MIITSAIIGHVCQIESLARRLHIALHKPKPGGVHEIYYRCD